ncbi:MAG: AbrB/MazE/SpoVT family DNA-binding domain-containing protein, partial [Rubrobacter sp.]|nr:AbrB/MazE/SpoVT family DNA-binding domain-containing protein [Rubrobacter sp.]
MPQPKRMTRIIRPLRGGQITIPAEFRRELGITEESMLQVTLSEGALHLKPVHLTTERGEGSPSLKELYEYFAPAREEVLEKGYTEE